MSSSIKIYLQRDFAKGAYLSEAPFPSRFFLVSSSNFVGSESGQIQSFKHLPNMVSNRTQHPQPLPATHCLFTLYFDTGKGEREERVEPERR